MEGVPRSRKATRHLVCSWGLAPKLPVEGNLRHRHRCTSRPVPTSGDLPLPPVPAQGRHMRLTLTIKSRRPIFKLFLRCITLECSIAFFPLLHESCWADTDQG